MGSLDYLREAVDEGNRLGVKVVMYMNPGSLRANNPLCHEVAVRGADGREITPLTDEDTPDSYPACTNHPAYRDFLARVLTEVFTDYGPAGVYVDGVTAHRCFCRHCREKYQRMFGKEMPVEKLAKIPARDLWIWEMVSRPEPVGDPNDPDCQQYTEFLNQSGAEINRLVSETVKRCKPDAVTIFHSYAKPSTVQYYDATLTEIYLEHPWKHKLWKSGEMASYSNVFPVPVLFNIYLHAHGTEAEARLHAFQGLANGCYPNFWNLVGMKPIFRFMRENAECFDFARTTPVKYLAFPRGVHEDVAQFRLSSSAGAAKPPTDRFLGSYVGLYSALVRRGLPVVTLHRGDFHKRLDGFKVLCLANEACMSAEQVEAVRQFVKAGGGLIATHETSLYDEKGNRRGDFGLADVFGAHYVEMLPATAREVRIDVGHTMTEGLPNRELQDLFPARGAQFRLEPGNFWEMMDEPTWVHNDPHVLARLDGADSLATLQGTEADPRTAPAILIHRYGAGRVVYLPGRFEGIQSERLSYRIQRLFANAARYVGRDSAPVEVRAPAPVAVTLFDQPERRILHLVNLNGDSLYQSDQIAPIENIQVRLQIPVGRTVSKLRRLWDRAEVPFRVEGNYVSFTLDRLSDYEAVSAELGDQ